jgi:hypothetical protein
VDPGVLFDEKNPEVENLVRLSLKETFRMKERLRFLSQEKIA